MQKRICGLDSVINDSRNDREVVDDTALERLDVDPFVITVNASHFLERTCQVFGHRALTLSKQQATLLKRYDWPGNIRELKNVIERAVILSRGKVLRLDLAMSDILHAPHAADEHSETAVERVLTDGELRDLERQNLVRALRASNGRVSGPNGAAKLLGIKPTTLTDRIKKFRISNLRQRA